MTQLLKQYTSTFFESKYLDHKIVVNKTKKTDVNYSKLVNKILGHHRFKELVLTRSFLNSINLYFELKKIDIHINKVLSVSHFCNLTNNIFYQVKGNAKINGTYGPIDFIDYILNICDKSTCFKIKENYKTNVINLLKKYNINNNSLFIDISKL